MLFTLREVYVCKRKSLTTQFSFLNDVVAYPVCFKISIRKRFCDPFPEVYIGDPGGMSVDREYPSDISVSSCPAEFRISPYSGTISQSHAAKKHIVFTCCKVLSQVWHVEENSIKNTAVVSERAFRYGTSSGKRSELHLDKSAARKTVFICTCIHGTNKMTSVLIFYRIIRQQVAYCLNACC